MLPGVKRGESRDYQRSKDQKKTHELHCYGHRTAEQDVKTDAAQPLAHAEPQRENHAVEQGLERKRARVDPENLPDEKLLQVLAAARILREDQDRGARGHDEHHADDRLLHFRPAMVGPRQEHRAGDRKSTRLNSSHSSISYAVFCLKKKKKEK